MSDRKDPKFEILKILEKHDGQTVLENIISETSLDHSAVMRAVLELEKDGLVEKLESKRKLFKLTDEGKSYAENGLPERVLAEAVNVIGGIAPLDVASKKAKMSEQLANIALGWMVKKGWCQIKKEGGLLTIKMRTLPPEGLDENILRLARLKGEIDSTDMTPEKLETAKTLVKRKLLIEREVITRTIKLTDYAFHEIKKGIKPKIEVTRLTSELITSGKWKEVKLREYDVTASPPMIYPGKKQFYLEFLEDVKRVLLSLGFVEAEGPYVETEFWNFDVLFQAQDHPAREIHDSYTLKHPKQGVISENEKLVERVKKTHENGWTTGSLGWRYKWSIEVASRLILRTQTTAVSMRYLAEHKEPPVKMFCISRVFRPDVLDAKHSMEFLQCEGIVMDKGLTFRHLLGFLNEFAKALDLGKIIFKPGYFPFTEPSVESFVKHPKLGWIEFVGAGMFRPEVLQPLEINYPVLAWGIGMDRIAMASLEVDDIRDLFSKRLDFLRRK